MKRTSLYKIIDTSFFISISILIDIFFSIFQIKFFKLTLVVLFLGGYFLGFLNGLIICIFYTLWHLIRSFYSFTILAQSLNFNNTQIYFSIFLDYILPNLIISLSGFCFYKKNNQKEFFLFFLLINFLRMLSTSLSSIFIYRESLKKHISEQNILISALLFNLTPFITNLFIGGFCVFYLKNRLKDIFDK
ncbi:hypothetical protein CWO85_03205 [Candidatus Phytoplasma ziziphi]|uniref:ECF transporter S component n=1 Tax=Ziziphus jujuba witches'-broom phytoplasma TaxID=135727 RepID=A0A660HN94_ZIZJU|nr:hypothetical protein [Candidatus Phytoplasma ziziphi]AYJ01485.1 hypothetical protein CWO85_03205 [Candidatus Phytoplasma ziziphi]